MTEYVATRWYRAPEILLGVSSYGFAVDMWAVGCILGEMIVGKPIFPGQSTLNQLEKITALTGLPEKRIVNDISKYAVSLVRFPPASHPPATHLPTRAARWLLGSMPPPLTASCVDAGATARRSRRW